MGNLRYEEAVIIDKLTTERDVLKAKPEAAKPCDMHGPDGCNNAVCAGCGHYVAKGARCGFCAPAKPEEPPYQPGANPKLYAQADLDAAVAQEREACAVLVEDTDIETYDWYPSQDNGSLTLANAAKAIRARKSPDGGGK